MNYFSRGVSFLLEHKQLLFVSLFLISFAGSMLYSWGPPVECD